jgi:signal transduction histidine kinase
MDNMLHWAKSQMQADDIQKERTDVQQIIKEVIQLLNLQAENKQVYLDFKGGKPVFAWADKEMIRLVLRNLVSNAIKFTPHNGIVSIGAHQQEAFIEVFVQDTGTGISNDVLAKINQNCFYTTKGTASESGTGLGLMLCREFLNKKKNTAGCILKVNPAKAAFFRLPFPHRHN